MHKKMEKIISVMTRHKVRLDTGCAFTQITTFGCGGKIALVLYPNSIKQLVFVAKYLRNKIKHCFLGHGSNVLASDKDYNGVVVLTTHVKQFFIDDCFVVADCGVSAPFLCTQLVKNGLSGGEFLGCLPATIGGAVVCNAGCFAQSADKIVHSVLAFHKGRILRLSNKKCKFRKRTSIFKNSDYVVLQVTMKFTKAQPAQIQSTVNFMRTKKVETQPLSARSAGSVLYNEKIAVSRLIDLAGLKGFTIGRAQVSEKHAGFVINLDKSTSKDIYLLIQHVRNTVLEKFGVDTEIELCFINFEDE